jgi:Tfp pilus assembly protein PilN
VKAVNLIPPEQRRGGGAGSAGRTGGAVYVLLGGLAVVVVALAAWVLTNNAITDHKAELAKVNREASVATAQAAALRPFREFAQLRADRVLTVQALARSRFDWQRAFTDLARVIPSDVWLTSMVATVKPGVNFGGSGSGAPDSGDTGQLRGDLQVPAIELVGCTLDQAEVAQVLTRLRLITGVQRVSLASSSKSDTAVLGSASSSDSGAAGAGGAGGSDDCRHGSRKFPKFSLVIFFDATPAATLPGTSGAATGGAGTPPNAASAPQTAGQAGAKAASTGGASQ